MIIQFTNEGEEFPLTHPDQSGRSYRTVLFAKRNVDGYPRCNTSGIAEQIAVSFRFATTYLLKLAYSGRVGRRKRLLRSAKVKRRKDWVNKMAERPLVILRHCHIP